MEIKEMLLTPNKYSRPQIPLKRVTNIVIHWVGNASSTATANRNYFESLRVKKRYASSHYIVGLNGEVIRCIPENEIAYHANSANSYSIGIENCHPDWKGKFNEKTYNSLVILCAQLCEKYNLEPVSALIRHYDVTKKNCPKYYVDNPNEWIKFKNDVKKELEKNNKDVQLFFAVNGIIKYGINIDINVWGNVNTMNMKYAQLLIERIGLKYGKTSYEQTIDLLVNKGCISSRSIWDAKKFKPELCRALLIKVYYMLINK